MNILVTGGHGMVGQYLQKIMPDAIFVGSKDFDLTSGKEAALLVAQERPDWIIHLAAKVGGILDNQKSPCSYYEDNMLMNTNILRAARVAGVKRFTGVLSTCAYPDQVPDHPDAGIYPVRKPAEHPYPLKEEYLHAGPPAKLNFGYGVAKRALATHIDTCNDQYGTKYNYIIPCNLYGMNDDYHPERSHYVAALIRKIYLAKNGGEIELFGTGKPLRQFMYAGDFAKAIREMVDRDITESFNMAFYNAFTIEEIAGIAINAIGKDLTIKFNDSFPDGQYRKDVSIEKFNRLFPMFNFTTLTEGIKKTYNHYSLNYI